MLSVEITNEQQSLHPDEPRIVQAVRYILAQAGVESGVVSIAIVDDPTIHELNRQFLEHDYPTDVLSFLLEREAARLEGEVIVSADTAMRMARELGWQAEHELTLYVVHGTLHLVGYDDLAEPARSEMRAAERRVLEHLGIGPPASSASWS